MRTLILTLPADAARPVPWALFEAPLQDPVRTGAADPGAALASDLPFDRCWVLAGGADVTAHVVELPPDAGGHALAFAAAFALEDRLAVDPAELHVALGAARDGGRLVCVAGHRAMAAWMDRLARLGVRADLLIPDFLAIAGGPVLHQGFVLAADPEAGFSAETGLAALITDEPAAPISTADLLRGAYTVLLARAPVNLLQGRYAPRRDWGPILAPWRRAAALAAGVFVAALAGIALDGARLNRQAEAATARAEAVFRAALPEVTRVVNPRAQMRAHLQGVAFAGDGGFLALSESLVAAIGAVDGAEVAALRFDARRGEIAASVSLPSFEAVERLKGEMTGRGAMVAEGGARQDGTGILADLTVRRR